MGNLFERYRELLQPKQGILANTIVGHAGQAINTVQKGVNNFVNTNKFLNSPTPNKKDDPSITTRQAISNTFQQAPKGFGDLYRKIPVVGNFAGRTMETIGSGTTDLLSSSFKLASTPDMKPLDTVGTVAQGIYGYGKILGAGTPLFQGVNALTSLGGETPLARTSAGFMEGFTGIQGLTSNDVKVKNQTIKALGQEFEIDPYKMVGEMIGFVRNPTNSRLFGATEKLNFLRSAKSPQARILGFLATNTFRGASEDILMSLKDMPEGATTEDKIRFLVENGLMGAISEVTMRGAGSGAKRFRDTQVGTALYDMIRNAIKGVPTQELVSMARQTDAIKAQPRDPQGRYDRVMQTFPSDLQAGRTIRETQTGGIDRRTGKRVKYVVGPDRMPPRFGEGTESAMGAIAGFEPEYDEEGNFTGVGYDPGRGVLGIGLMAGLSRAKRAEIDKRLFERLNKASLQEVETSAKGVVDSILNSTVKEKDQFLKQVRAGFGKYLSRNFGAGTGNYKTDYAMLRSLENDVEVGPVIKTIFGEIDRIDDVLRGGTVVTGKSSLTNQKSGTKALQQVPSTQLSAKVASQTPSLKSQGLQSNSVVKTSVSGQQPRRVSQSSDAIIQEGRASIGSISEKPSKNVKQTLDSLYTQWVDRYHPISLASKQVKKVLKGQGAELRPEVDPDVLVRRLTGAGGIADYRFKTELNPVLKEMEKLNIDKTDMDVYLAHRRMAGFGDIGRDVYGTNPQKSKQIVAALEAKYGGEMSRIADKLYAYQDKGFQEMVDAGFISPENAKLIKEQNPDYSPLFRVMDEVDEYLGVPTRKTMQGSQPIQKIKGSKRQILSPVESIIGNTFSQRAAIEKNRVAKSIVNLQKVDPSLGFTKVSKAGNDTITVWNNGSKEYWRVGTDIAEVAKGANEEAMNLVLKIIQKPASILRQGATGRNPEFMIPNVIRDQLDAGVTSKYGYIPFVDYFSGLRSMMKNDEVYQKWQNSGAKIDLGELSGKKEIAQLFDEKTQKKNLFTWLGKGLDVMGKYSEQPTRVGLFKKAYNKTGNEMLAMMESRDATVDFSRMGNKMKVANSVVPFLNVGIQGFDKLVRSAKNNPGKVALMMGTYAAAPAVATTIYNLTNHPEEYDEIPGYEKESNFVLVMGRNEDGTVDYISIPKGHIAPIAANPIQSFLEYAFDNDKTAFGEMAMATISGALPVIGEGSSAKEIAIKTIGSNLPQAIKPATENLLNKSFYKYDPNKQQNKEIVPYYLQDKPAYKQDYKFTPVMYKKIGAVLNVSPLQVQNMMEGYLAGYSKIPAQVIEMAVKSSKGEEISPNEKTLLRRFVKQTYPSSGNTKPKVEAPVPGLMERVTGSVSASTGELDNTFAPSVAQRQQVEDSYNEAIKIMKDEYTESKDKMKQIEALGLNQAQVAYDMKTRLPDDLQYDQIKYELTQAGEKDFAKTLVKMREVSPGSRKQLLTDTIINKMAKDGFIDKGTANYLKSIVVDEKTGKLTTKKSSGGGTKVKKLPAGAFKSPPKIKVARVADRDTTIKVSKINVNPTRVSRIGGEFNPQVNTAAFARARVRA